MLRETKIPRDALTMLKQIVADAGGEWCGVQESLSDGPPLLMFTSPETCSTLAIPFDPLSFDGSKLYNTILAKIAESSRKFADRPITVKASVLKDLSNRLLQLSTEIDGLYLRKKS